jgi:hypothetical protein
LHSYRQFLMLLRKMLLTGKVDNTLSNKVFELFLQLEHKVGETFLPAKLKSLWAR